MAGKQRMNLGVVCCRMLPSGEGVFGKHDTGKGAFTQMTHLHAEAADHDGRNIDEGRPSAVWDGGGHHQRRRAACQHIHMLLVQSGEFLL